MIFYEIFFWYPVRSYTFIYYKLNYNIPFNISKRKSKKNLEE
jgi:hypothetical protein